MITDRFDINGYSATVLIPDNPNGKWIWKTEFFDAFDKAERELFDMGYTRVYYQISNKFGSPESVRLMHRFHRELLKRYSFLTEKTILFGFSRGGLYAFNYALYYPEYVAKIYLDAPVLNVQSWPGPKKSEQHDLFCKEHNLTDETFLSFSDSPLDNLAEFAENDIPLLIVAGDEDKSVPIEQNTYILDKFYRSAEKDYTLIVKKGCGHHPHSLEDVGPIIAFAER